MKRYLELSCHALIGTAFFTLALTERLETATIIGFAFAYCVGLHRTIRSQEPLLTTRSAFVVSCAYIVVFFLDVTVLSRSMIDGTVHLLLFLQMAKLNQHKSDRDYLYLILLAFVTVLAASSMTVDISFAATLFLFLIALVSTLMSFEMYRSERDSKMPPHQAVASLSGVSVWTTVWIVVLGAGFFFTIPRFGVGYFTRASTVPLLLSGYNDNVTLGQIGELKLSSALVMHARRVGRTPFTVLKWRGVTLDTFDGRDWTKKKRARDFVPVTDGIHTLKDGPIKGDPVSYEILLEPVATTTLFGPYEVRRITSRVIPGIEVDDAGAIYARFQPSRRQQYRVESEIPKRTPVSAAETNAPELSGTALETYLQLPQSMDTRIRDLALQITADGRTPYDKALRVETYLKRNYNYTLLLNWNPGRDPLGTFLFSAKSGHCEYFASSMAVLLRAAGIPTRIVNGFLMGEYNPVGDAYVVRQSDAHSWVEAYLPGTGWTEFDPTPGDAATQPDGTLISQLGHYADAVGLFWKAYVLTYDTDSQMQLFRSAQESVQGMQRALQERTDSWAESTRIFTDNLTVKARQAIYSSMFWLYVAIGIAVAAAFRRRADLWTRWQLLLATHRGGGGGERLVAALFYRAVRLAEPTSAHRRSSETWREWIAGLQHERRRTILTHILDIFERSKYGGESTSANDLEELQQALRELRGLLQ